jgi:hypothetical protein
MWGKNTNSNYLLYQNAWTRLNKSQLNLSLNITLSVNYIRVRFK